MNAFNAIHYRVESTAATPSRRAVRCWFALLTLLVTLAHTPVKAVVAIDDFSAGAFSQTLGVTGNLPWVGFQSGSMIGGSRAVLVETFDNRPSPANNLR